MFLSHKAPLKGLFLWVKKMSLPVVIYLILLLCAAVCLVSGVYLLVGLAFSLLAASVVLFGAAAFLRKGMV